MRGKISKERSLAGKKKAFRGINIREKQNHPKLSDFKSIKHDLGEYEEFALNHASHFAERLYAQTKKTPATRTAGSEKLVE